MTATFAGPIGIKTVLLSDMDPEKASSQPMAEVHFRGSCACARMTYACTSIPSSAQACHCVSCRKLSGSPYQAFADVPATSLTFYDNTENLRHEGLPKDNIGGITFIRLSEVAERAFCVSCHASLAFRYKPHPNYMGVPMGSIDESSLKGEEVKEALKLKKHIFVSQKVSWVDVTKDGLPTFERFSGTFEQDLYAANEKKG